MVLLAPKDSPPGNDPDVSDQVKGEMPPDSCNEALYVTPPVAPGKDFVVTEGGGTTVIVLEADLLGSVTEVATRLTDKFDATGFGAV